MNIWIKFGLWIGALIFLNQLGKKIKAYNINKKNIEIIESIKDKNTNRELIDMNFITHTKEN